MTTRNELADGTARIGRYAHARAEAKTPPTWTLLQNTGDRIQLTIPWMDTHPTSQVERWFHGSSVRYGDDPDQTRYSYDLPDELLFHDSYGYVGLIGCRAVGLHSTFGVSRHRYFESLRQQGMALDP